jgi:hypothetical protein
MSPSTHHTSPHHLHWSCPAIAAVAIGGFFVLSLVVAIFWMVFRVRRRRQEPEFTTISRETSQVTVNPPTCPLPSPVYHCKPEEDPLEPPSPRRRSRLGLHTLDTSVSDNVRNMAKRPGTSMLALNLQTDMPSPVVIRTKGWKVAQPHKQPKQPTKMPLIAEDEGELIKYFECDCFATMFCKLTMLGIEEKKKHRPGESDCLYTEKTA